MDQHFVVNMLNTQVLVGVVGLQLGDELTVTESLAWLARGRARSITAFL